MIEAIKKHLREVEQKYDQNLPSNLARELKIIRWQNLALLVGIVGMLLPNDYAMHIAAFAIVLFSFLLSMSKLFWLITWPFFLLAQVIIYLLFSELFIFISGTGLPGDTGETAIILSSTIIVGALIGKLWSSQGAMLQLIDYQTREFYDKQNKI